VIAVITGEGGSGGALALAVADRVLALEHAVYSVISPEGCAAILWNRQDAAPLAAAALGMGARELLGRGVVDAVVAEPEGGAQADPAGAVAAVRDALCEALDELDDCRPDRLVALRRRRFRRFGQPEEAKAT
jgi:acetyl-CoA carboxylase carboxyl transferase subunit beta